MESHSAAVEEEDVPHPLTEEAERLLTITLLDVYREAALANYAEAEELISRALELRESGHAMLERAGQIAAEWGGAMDHQRRSRNEPDW